MTLGSKVSLVIQDLSLPVVFLWRNEGLAALSRPRPEAEAHELKVGAVTSTLRIREER